MEEIKSAISESFYTQPLMPLSALITLILGIIHRKKFSELKIMPFYPLASLAQSAVFFFWVFSEQQEEWKVGRISISLFILVEFLIFYRFFNAVIVLEKLKIKMQVIAVSFLAYLLSIWVFTDSFYKDPSNLFLPESLCILSFCFMYFFQIFKLPPELHLINSPAFWITIGCLFYFSCTIPLFFANEILLFLPNYYSIYSINYLAYAILFLFISKAFLCNRIQMK